ncbi:MAG: hypothetical protein PVG99_04695 [Desulfobacteraceae bacterium]|jgi:hypothetical protein
MSKNRHPIYKKGDRNAFCPFYSVCLDEAVKKSWAYWDCSECDHRSSRDSSFDIENRVNDSMPYYDLPDDIFEKVC